ncbi:MAG: hypothetical protein HYW65_00675 [Candidatus Liptonbacteria bacterium]|nr:hypothetical protein [Candidatus Liptonbacteria bacterium]
MTLRYTPGFLYALEVVPPEVRKAFFKQARFLASNLQHPSLRAKKYDEARGVWQARVNKYWRFYFRIEGGTYYILDIMLHPK